MKKYFFKKTFVWILILDVVTAFIRGAVPGILIPILTFSRLSIDATKISTIITGILTPICIALCIFSGHIFANRLKNDGKFEGNFSKYQYIYYSLTHIGGYLISEIGATVCGVIVTYAYGKVNENDIGSMIATEFLISTVVNIIFGIIFLIVSAKFVSSLLCAVTESEEAEKNYFSKAFFPFTMSMLIAVVISIIYTVCLKQSVFTVISDIVYVIYFAGLLALLKYKFGDEKIMNFTCNILPFGYVLICVVFEIIRLMHII